MLIWLFNVITLMLSKLVIVCLLIAFVPVNGIAQPPIFKTQKYIATYAEEAINQMVNYKIPASVIMAQAIFESKCGSSQLAQRSNNHFGIKCHIEWGGDTVVKTDDTLNECFRKYERVTDSYTDHSLFLRSRSRYAYLFELPINDYANWCIGLKASGYATYPTYAEELIQLIENLRLYELDGYKNLTTIQVNQFERDTLLESPFKRCNIPLKEFCAANLLWVNEKDVLIQSLDLMLKGRSIDSLENIDGYETLENTENQKSLKELERLKNIESLRTLDESWESLKNSQRLEGLKRYRG
jgi:Mannosyl-glycoprotein endo-beta-N-acetylglucosaminidase